MLRSCCLVAILMGAVAFAGAGSSPPPLARRIEVARAAVAAADAKKTLPADQQAKAVETLFDLLDRAGQLETDEAQALAARDVELRRAQAPNGSTALALALWRSAIVAGQRNRFADAMTTAQRALAMLQQQTPPDPVAQAMVRITLGAILTTQRKFDESIALLEGAIAELDANHSTSVSLAYGLKALAFDYAESEKFDRAQAAIDRAIAIASALEGHDSVLQASYLIVASLAPLKRGDTAAAIALLERALPILRDANPPVPSTYELGLLTLAQTLKGSGDCRRAQPLLRKLIETEDAHPSAGGTRFLASALNTLAYCLGHDGHSADAAAAYERALSMYRKLSGEESAAALMVESNLANAYEELGRRDDEIAMLRHVIEVTDRTRAKDAPDMTPARANLGYTYVWLGRYAEAEPLFRDYLAHLGPGRDLSERDPRGAMAGLAVCLWAQGHGEEAFAEALATERSRQKLVRTAGADLGEQHAVKMSGNAISGLDWALAIAAQDGRADHARAVWESAVESRGLVNAISARRLAAARAASDPQLAAVWHEWKQRDEALVQARVEAARNPSAATSAALDATEQRFDEAERALAHAEGTGGAELGRAHADLTSILAVLPTNTLLVSYVEADASQPHDLDHPAGWEQHGRLYAFAATRGRKPMLLDLGPRPAVQEAVWQWLDLAVEHDSDPKARAAAGRRVRELVWDPIRGAWPQKRVFVVPSAMLERVPFAALPSNDARYLVEAGYVFHYLDHERDVLVPQVRPDASPTLTLIGAPDFTVAANEPSGSRGVCAGLRGATFTALPQAAREIGALRDLWLQRAGAAAPTVLEGEEATEARTRAVLHDSRIVHFATHGIFLGDRCRESAADTRGVELDESTPPAPGALELSALVLSGANRAATSTENDGLLTSEEVATLDLTGTDWAVLSACDSGIGMSVNGEGVFGLRRAFRLAGARSVVMSLWQVSDNASADWMLVLYRARLLQHASTIDAVRSADLASIEQRRKAGLDPAPYYWAAFEAVGDWR
jgi:CHAT domain-containing protein